MRNLNWLRVLLGLSALLVAGCAAYFSVTGLGVLFSGASIAVMIMAGSLEFAKLTAATYLKQRWTTIKGVNKWYLTISVVVLMIITSAGIFGFLSNAFQQQNIRIEQVQREINVWDTKIKSGEQQIATLTTQINNLQSNQGKILDNGKINNRLLKSVDSRDKQVQKLQDKINSLQDSSLVYNGKINEIKNQNIHLEREIGGFRFVAESFNFPLNSVVKFFIILIVFVFDPLALALVIAFNQLLLETKSDNKKEPEPTEEPVDPKLFADEVARVHLTDEDLKILEEKLLKPQEPNDNLKSAKEEYEEELNKKDENSNESYHHDDDDDVTSSDNRRKKHREDSEDDVTSDYTKTKTIDDDGGSGPRENNVQNEEFKRPIEETVNNGDQSHDNEIVKEPSNAPQNASEMMQTTNQDVINSIPSDDEVSDMDLNEEQYQPTQEEEKENFSTIEPTEGPESGEFSTMESETENIFQEETINEEIENHENDNVEETDSDDEKKN